MTRWDHFGRLPREYIKAGALRGLKCRQVKVYMAIALHAGKNFEARPSINTIVQITGYSKRTVQRAIQELIELGHLKADRSGGKGITSRYQLTSKGDTHGDTLFMPKGDTLDGTLSDIKDDSNDMTKGANQGGTRKKQGKNKVCSSDLEMILEELGVQGAALDHLLQLDDLTANDVRSVWERAKTKATKNRVGLLVKMLKDGERESDEHRRTRLRKASLTVEREKAQKLLDSIPKPSNNELEKAQAWLHEVGPKRVFSITLELYPDLKISSEWVVQPYQDPGVLVSCWKWAAENSIQDNEIIKLLSA